MTRIGKCTLSSPIILGSFDPLIEARVLEKCFDLCGDSLGAVVTKSTTIEPRSGYPEPKVSKFGDGLLVASGNPNPGIEQMVSEVSTCKRRNGNAVIFGSIVSDPDRPQSSLAEEYCHLATRYAGAGVDGLEMNLSCPHLDPSEKEHTIVPAQDADLLRVLVEAVKSRLVAAGFEDCLVIPKLTGWNCDPALTARAAEQAGADAVTVSNLFPGTGYYTGIGVDDSGSTGGYKPGDYLVANGKGGYSGKAMHSAVLLMIESLRKHAGIPIIGTGGCASDLDSLVQTFMAGATAVESVTPFYFRNWHEMDALLAMNKLMRDLNAYLASRDMVKTAELYRLRDRIGNG
jgi:dihydroorotate dehydrogenase (fumarate)